jgi:hypothetical protein
MADVNLYFYLENVALTVNQRDNLISQVKTWGKRDQDPNPKNRNHWRVKPDSQAVIFEAWIDEARLTVLNLRQWLADLYGVELSDITASTASTAFGQVVSITYNTFLRLRVGVFGGVAAEYAASQAAARAYLNANAAVWEV